MNVALRACRIASPSLTRPICSTSALLSGHNKWSKIKQRKGANDAKKGALYAKATMDILIAARLGGNPDPEVNATLAAVLKRVKSAGVPKENIENALKKAVAKGTDHGEIVTYEAMIGTVGMIIECMSTNPTRTIIYVREAVHKAGARLTPCAFMFNRQGLVRVALEQGDDFDARLEKLVEAAFEAEAEDFEQSDPSEGVVEIEFKCPPTALAKVTNAVTAPGLCKELLASEMVYVPTDPADAPDEETESRLERLVDTLEGLEDTRRVWTTLD